MATIKFDIDTQVHDTLDQPRLGPRKKLGILSAIKLDSSWFSSELDSEIEKGYGANTGTSGKAQSVSKGNLKTKRAELLDPDGHNCKFLVTLGGMFVPTTLSYDSNTPVPYVSLVGSIPDIVESNCCGGVSLESWKSNALRVRFLTGVKGVTRNNICLYREDGTHSQEGPVTTGVPSDELDNWTNSPASGGLGLTKVKTCSGNIDNDLNGGGGLPAGTTALVISASPHFLNNRNLLVTAVNAWLSATPHNTTRYVVYPLQIYREGTAPPLQNFSDAMTAKEGKNILFGPDLRKACRLLGYLAGIAHDNDGIGWWSTVPNVKYEFP
jgi:hypothetical protein